MDPIAHTLFGAALGQTKLKELTALSTTTLMIGANLPDIDVVAGVLGSDASLLYRRGITHGVIAMVVLPLLLSAGMLGYDRYWRRKRDPEKEPVRGSALVVLSFLGVWSHPFLDWLNTYGVRLLMPFDGRWFYGDTLFIIDAWMWLLMGASVFFAYSETRLKLALWIGLGLALSALITLAPMVPWGAKVVWWLALVAIALRKQRGVQRRENQQMATMLLIIFCVYVAAMMGGNTLARDDVEGYLAQEFDVTEVEVSMTRPMPANPFVREVIARADGHYYGVRVPLLGSEEMTSLFAPVVVEEPDEVIAKALRRQEVQGFVNWMRFPTYEVRLRGERTEVVIRDLRYVEPDAEQSAGIGMARVIVE